MHWCQDLPVFRPIHAPQLILHRAPPPPLCPQSNPKRAPCAKCRAASAPCTSSVTTTRCVPLLLLPLGASAAQGAGLSGRGGAGPFIAPPPPCPACCLQRYKICPYHLELACLVVEGQTIRFCQQCGRFQLLSDFEGDRRSCRRKVRAALLCGEPWSSRDMRVPYGVHC